MTSFILCILFPVAVLSMNYTNNINNIKIYTDNITAIFQNTQNINGVENPIIRNVTSTEKYLLSTNKTIIGKKSKSQNKLEVLKKKNVTVKPIKRDLSDMPLEIDLEEIMASLHKVLDFFLENKNDVDISMNYGLFLLNVNLRTVMKNKSKSLPSGIEFNLKHLLEKTDVLLTFFKKMVERDNNPDDDLSKSLTNLFNHERLWMFRVQKFDGSRVNETTSETYEKLTFRYSYWEKYLDNIGDFNKAQPRPDQSNQCLSYLAKNHATKKPWKKECQIPIQCRKPLVKGSDYGYGLTHRLLFLQLAYYGHRCYVFSVKKDQEMREKFCKSLYSEATYISLNEYGAVDLFVEQISLCALDGHYQFLRRSWLQSIMDYQTDAGCFSDVAPDKRPNKPMFESALRHTWQLDKGENQYIMGGQCNVHTSSAAAAALAFGVKFILETYY